jgi:6-pyruvoyltetrahydropterin/6-carboxytetrahydropterin synthase
MGESQRTEHYRVRVAGEALRFSAAHFITFADGSVEPLHGHDYSVAAEIVAPLGPHGYTVDFLVVEQALKDLIRALDHRTLLPEGHPEFCVDVRTTEIEIALGTRRWILPRNDCVLLPIQNTTAEALAGYLARGLLAKLEEQSVPPPTSVRVEVSEMPGFTASCTLGPP